MKKLLALSLGLLFSHAYANNVCENNTAYAFIDKTEVNLDRGESVTLTYCDKIVAKNGYRVIQEDNKIYVDVAADVGTTYDGRPFVPMRVPIDLNSLDLTSNQVKLVLNTYLDGSTEAVTYTEMDISITDQVKNAITDPSGSWYDANMAGMGFAVMQLPVGSVVQFYGYGRWGAPMWLLSDVVNETWVKGQTKTIQLYNSDPDNGAHFNRKPDAGSGIQKWGTLQLRFDACDKGYARLAGADGTQKFNLTRLAGLNNGQCHITD